MLTVAVTGGTGFVGRVLVKELVKQGYCVRILTRSSPQNTDGAVVFIGDLCDEQVNLDLFFLNVDVLFHCAGELNDESKMKKLHVFGTKRLLYAAEQAGVQRFVQLSSVGAYGNQCTGVITEYTNENPSNIYERTKTESDNIVSRSDIKSFIVRPSNIFGNNMPNNSLRQLVNAIQSGRFFYIGNKCANLNYVHVDDVVSALILVGKSEISECQTYIVSQNIETGTLVAALQNTLSTQPSTHTYPECIIRILSYLFGWIPSFPLTIGRVNAMTRQCVYDSGKIENELGFKYKTSLKESIILFTGTK